MKQILFSKVVFAVLLSLMVSCSFDYEEAMAEEILSAKNPDSVLLGFSQTIVKEGQAVMKITADRAEHYDSQNLAVAYGLHFVEYGAGGRKLTEGWAEKAIYQNDTEDADFTGAVFIRSEKEESNLRTESISWDSQNEILSAPPDARVTLEKDDGSSLSGLGFEANLRYMEIQFGKDVKGVYLTSEEGQ